MAQRKRTQAHLKRRTSSKTTISKSRRHSHTPKFASISGDTIHETRKRRQQTTSDKSSHSAHCSNNIIPPWSSLPYEILGLIFHYASYPLFDHRTFHALPSVKWLLRASRLCKAFSEPALTVLYRSPPLVPMENAHKLRQLLVADPEPMSYNYRAKIERLHIEVMQTAAYTLPGSGVLDLHGLIYHCPRLQDLELYHQKDFSPYMKLSDSIKWHYPDSLFVALNENISGSSTKLRSWRWSSRLAGKKRPIESLVEIHQSPSFSSIRKLAFVNYQKVWVRPNVEDPQHEKLLANSLSVLDLEHLVFESSTILNSTLLPLLPTQLKHLEIINCSEVCSDDLAAFLGSHGSQMRTLILDHNISLNLSFLKVLGSCCHQLKSLRMNLTYYNAFLPHSPDPKFEFLLDIKERPQWPTTLQTLELTHLRKWDIDIAKMFFQSLLESADNLVDLRQLLIKAILNTSWRDRSSFRDEWVGAFKRIFKRPLESFSIASNGPGKKPSDIDGDSQLHKPNLSRRSSRQTAVRLESGTDQNTSQTAYSLVNESAQKQTPSFREIKRKSTDSRELKTLRKTAGQSHKAYEHTYQHDDAPDSDSDDMPLATRSAISNTKKKPTSIQGMCEVVSITIDNLRPTENQFVEADFLDSEPEGDDDWDGTEEVQGEGLYAW